MRVYDKENLQKMSVNMLKQRKSELNDELAIVSRRNVKLKVAILLDKLKVILELDRRKQNV